MGFAISLGPRKSQASLELWAWVMGLHSKAFSSKVLWLTVCLVFKVISRYNLFCLLWVLVMYRVKEYGNLWCQNTKLDLSSLCLDCTVKFRAASSVIWRHTGLNQIGLRSKVATRANELGASEQHYRFQIWAIVPVYISDWVSNRLEGRTLGLCTALIFQCKWDSFFPTLPDSFSGLAAIALICRKWQGLHHVLATQTCSWISSLQCWLWLQVQLTPLQSDLRSHPLGERADPHPPASACGALWPDREGERSW